MTDDAKDDQALPTETQEQVPDAAMSSEESRKAAARERLLKSHVIMAEKRAAGWKPILLNPVEKAKANPGSAKMAIKAHCWTCSGAGADPGVKLRVRDCNVLTCALRPHRPWQNAKGRLVEGENGEMVPSEGSDTDVDGVASEGDEE